MSRASNRRRFLKNTAFAGIGFWTVGSGRAAETKSPNERLNIGSIGVAGRGGGDMMSVASENIVALVRRRRPQSWPAPPSGSPRPSSTSTGERCSIRRTSTP